MIGIDPNWIAGWVLWAASTWLAWVPLSVIAAGVLLVALPLDKPAWIVETGGWLVVVGALLTSISFVWILSDVSWPAAALLAILVVAYVAYWLMPSHRRIDLTTEAVITTGPETVFLVATDPDIQLRLHSTLQELYVKHGGPLGLGSIVVSREKAQPKRSRRERIVLEFDPPLRYSERELDVAPNRTRLSFESTNGGTRLRCEYLRLMSVPDALLSGYRKGRMLSQSLAYREQWFEAVRQEAIRDPD